jgi:hypothetical protein
MGSLETAEIKWHMFNARNDENSVKSFVHHCRQTPQLIFRRSFALDDYYSLEEPTHVLLLSKMLMERDSI